MDYSNYQNLITPIVVANENLNIIFINKATILTFGYSESELLTKNVKMLMTEGIANRHDEYIQNYKSGEMPKIIGTQGRTVKGKKKTGEIIDLVLSLSETWNGNQVTFIATFQNITRWSNKLKAQKEKYEVILNNVLSQIVVADDQLIINYVNKATEITFGFNKKELIGKSVKILMPSEIACNHDNYFQNYLDGNKPKVMGTTGRKVKGKKKDGTFIDLVMSISEFQEDGNRYFMAAFQDITDLEKQQSEQIKILESVAQTKASFVSNMSHEIRTPMNGIFGMLTLLNEEDNLDIVQKDYVKTCLSSAESLMNILDDILLFSKAEANSIELESIPFNLNTLIEDIACIMGANIPKHKKDNLDLVTYIQPDVPFNLIGDPGKLRQILLNLLSNAIKFTDNGEIAVEVFMESTNPLVLKFEINDTGIGLSKEQQKNLFQKFYQADVSISRKYGGTGLGLAICKLLVEKFKGEISVNSRLGRGSTFSFTTQLKVNELIKDNMLFDNIMDFEVLRGTRIFIIDDNATNCCSLSDLLEKYGCYTETSKSGRDGIERLKIAKIKSQKFDVLLLDYHMPDMNGLEVAGILDKYGFDDLKILALSSSLDHKILMNQSNVYACTSKPIRKKQLLYLLCNSLLPNQQLNKDIENKDIENKDIDKNNRIINKFSNSELKNTTVLIIEDNQVNREVIINFLNKIGFATKFAKNGLEALEILNSKENNKVNIDIIITDIHMPLMDGIELIKIIKNLKMEIPIIVLTADILQETKDMCLSLNVDHFMRKPVYLQELIEVMKKVLDKESNEKPVKQYHILVTDDIESNQLILKRYLEKISPNNKIDIANNGLEAVNLYKKNGFYDIVFMDVNMPIMDGIQATENIKNMNKDQIVIGLTGYDDEKEYTNCKNAGMNDILIKPIQINSLKNIYIKYIDMASLSRTSEKKLTKINDTMIDHNILKNIYDNDKELMDQAINAWKNYAQSISDNINKYNQEKDYHNLSCELHSIKGSSYQVGLSKIGDSAKDIELLIKKNKYDKLDKKINKLTIMINSFVKY